MIWRTGGAGVQPVENFMLRGWRWGRKQRCKSCLPVVNVFKKQCQQKLNTPVSTLVPNS